EGRGEKGAIGAGIDLEFDHAALRTVVAIDHERVGRRAHLHGAALVVDIAGDGAVAADGATHTHHDILCFRRRAAAEQYGGGACWRVRGVVSHEHVLAGIEV